MELKPQVVEVFGEGNPDEAGFSGYPYIMDFGLSRVLVIAPAVKVKKGLYRLIVIPDLGSRWSEFTQEKLKE